MKIEQRGGELGNGVRFGSGREGPGAVIGRQTRGRKVRTGRLKLDVYRQFR